MYLFSVEYRKINQILIFEKDLRRHMSGFRSESGWVNVEWFFSQHSINKQAKWSHFRSLKYNIICFNTDEPDFSKHLYCSNCVNYLFSVNYFWLIVTTDPSIHINHQLLLHIILFMFFLQLVTYLVKCETFIDSNLFIFS